MPSAALAGDPHARESARHVRFTFICAAFIARRDWGKTLTAGVTLLPYLVPTQPEK
jgi:hypothetical protein